MLTPGPAETKTPPSPSPSITRSRYLVLNLFATIATSSLLLLVRFYQVAVSPFTRPRCRYQPTCSEYARQALIMHGCAKGLLLAVKRLARCHPFSKGGVDLVPRCCGYEPSVIKRSR
jgi:putative membrane protein insertion efficiency factor